MKLNPNHLKIKMTQFVPELKLHLLCPEHPLWRQKYHEPESSLDPFWAIFWPGGQVLSRFILDSKIAHNKRGKVSFPL